MTDKTSKKDRSVGDGEFSLIREFFLGRAKHHSETTLGIGDDASILQVPEGKQLVISVDTMVEGVHFLRGADPESLGHKLLAVNLSDMAAMGAEPVWATLALTIPKKNKEWLEQFSRGLFALADRHRVDLVGGDTTRGPLTLTMQIHGLVSEGRAVRRSGADAGDLVCVTNTLGAAALALELIEQGRDAEEIRHHLERPTPRVEAGIVLRSYATSMIDISDGLLADLGHVLEQSGVGAVLDLDSIPLHPSLLSISSVEKRFDLALGAGDDYELCFTIAVDDLEDVGSQLSELGCDLSVVGTIQQGGGLRWEDSTGWSPSRVGFNHF